MLFKTILVFVSTLVVIKANDVYTPFYCQLFNYDEANVKHYIYNSQSPSGVVYQALSQLNSGEDLYLLMPSWTETKDQLWVQTVKNSLRANYPDANIVAADYSPYSQGTYLDNWCRAGRIARTSSEFLIAVKGIVGAIRGHGFSLGAEILGISGRLLIAGGGKFTSITGYDMAGPLFDSRPSTIPLLAPLPHLDSSCADDVKNINTDGSIIGYGYWLENPLDLARILFNGGKQQPGCDVALILCYTTPQDDLQLCLKRAVFCNHIYAFKVAMKLHGGSVYKIKLCDGGPELDYSKDTGHLPDGVYCTNGDIDANPLPL